MESLFGPPSEPINISLFLETALSQENAELQEIFDAEVIDECSVSELRESLCNTWSNPTLSAHLIKDHDHMVSALHALNQKPLKATRKSYLPDPDTLPVEVTNLQKSLDAVSLNSFRLKTDANMFMRTPKNSDRNILQNVNSAALSGIIPADQEAAITISVYNRITWGPSYVTRSSQHVFVSSQTLRAVYESLICVSKNLPPEASMSGIETGCVICIERVAYGTVVNGDNYAAKLLQVLSKKNTSHFTIAPSTQEETSLRSLTLRINEPYWLFHHGNCEHFVVIDQIRLLHPQDPRSGYPLTLQITPPILDLCRACAKIPASWSVLGDSYIIRMAIPTLTNQVVESLEQYEDVISWINDTITPNDLDDSVIDLTDLDHEITQLLTTLDIAAEDTSAQLERIIDDVSRGIPRLAYDLHFMKDGASTLQNALVGVLQRSRDAVPKETSAALDNLHHLDTIKGRMEASREVLREAESWSTLEHEVTSLIIEKSYAKAAERLSEANKSMVVFQNTPEYDPRRTLMINLQNQLEAALSTALVSAINAQDSTACRDYYSIFSTIQRESEFRNYYYASRRSSIVSLWRKTPLVDCEPVPTDTEGEAVYGFADFLTKFYAQFISILNTERSSISSIFPDPSITLSQFISSTMTSLQPTVAQRLTSYSSHHGESALTYLISALRATEEFATGVEKVMEKIKYASSTPLSPLQSGLSSEKPQAHRRRSSRMSISLRPGQHRSSSSMVGIAKAVTDSVESMEWDQELFQPFLDFQTDYGSLERRSLEHALYEIISNDTRDKLQASDRPRLFRERAVDIFGVAENSMGRCNSFTYGYGAVGLVHALDGFFQSFFDMWTADIQTESFSPSPLVKNSISESEFSDLDYTARDWANIQLSLHLLSSARTVFDRLCSFETRLRAYLSQVATHFRLSLNDPSNFLIAATKGESQLLEQSTLNSSELHALLINVENDSTPRDPPFSASHRLHPQTATHSVEPLLVSARKALSVFAQACQISTIKTILSPLRNHLSGYSSSSAWLSSADPTQMTSSNDLRVPTFSLSHSETVQRLAEGLLNLPRLFEVYADDDALAFSLESLPYVEPEMLQSLTEQTSDTTGQQSHRRRSSYMKPNPIDAEVVSSAWLISLGHTFLEYFTTEILPSIPSLSIAGAAQLASDLEYLSNIVHALNVEHSALDKWKTYVSMDANDGVKALSESTPGSLDPVLERVAKLRGWR
ncbi:hypothetical protein CVT25_011032 [Psilocybe cyanescens]|uniref:Conserved oligomeric Golgi complex subunit 7 n=1 Tax=Psilocybe cyanescens TaxID=93625 RepID=A0A409WFA7_PSICY|nr:hypothetical protein CVT25_011032 [Psilocybe cyanescens]